MKESSPKAATRPSDIPLLASVHGQTGQDGLRRPVLQSPVGEGLTGLRYIDDVGSRENILRFESLDNLDLKLNPDTAESSPLLSDVTDRDVLGDDHVPNNAIVHQPGPVPPCCPQSLAPLLDTGQIVVHMANLRRDVRIQEAAARRMEIIDETRRVLYHVEQDAADLPTESSFRFRIYDRDKNEAIQVFSPRSSTCVCCGASWHCMKRCRFEAIVYTPVGTVAGFVRRARTKFVQEFQILNASEEPLLVLRGGPQDLEICSVDLQNELGRLSVHGWVGIMHEVRRTSSDYGMTFPLDLDVRVKAVLVGAIFAIHWLYSTKGGKKN